MPLNPVAPPVPEFNGVPATVGTCAAAVWRRVLFFGWCAGTNGVLDPPPPAGSPAKENVPTLVA